MPQVERAGAQRLCQHRAAKSQQRDADGHHPGGIDRSLLRDDPSHPAPPGPGEIEDLEMPHPEPRGFRVGRGEGNVPRLVARGAEVYRFLRGTCPDRAQNLEGARSQLRFLEVTPRIDRPEEGPQVSLVEEPLRVDADARDLNEKTGR